MAGYAAGASESVAVPSAAGVRWDLVDDDRLQSTIANGCHAGTPFGELVRRFPQHVVGLHHPASRRFPLCVRILDVGQRQPLAVHPDDPLVLSGRTFLPNAKFWLSLAAAPTARIVVGINRTVTRLQVVDNLDQPAIEDLLQVFDARPGDAFFVPNGRLHAIGGGNLVWELMERVAPALRVTPTDAEPLVDGEQAAGVRAIAFQDRQLGRISTEASKVHHTRKVPLLHLCPQFVVDEIRLRDHIFDGTNGTTFHLLAMIRGAAEIRSLTGVEELPTGTVCCLPAGLGDYRVYARGDGATFLRISLHR